MVRCLLAVAASAGCVAGGPAFAQEAQADGPAREAVLQHLRAKRASPLEPPAVFSGDVDGDRLPDAVAFYAVPGAGASGAAGHLLVLQNTGKGYRVVAERTDVAVFQPRQVAVRPGVVEYTATVMGPRNPHCCPNTPERQRVSFKPPKPVTPDGAAPAVGLPSGGGLRCDAPPHSAPPDARPPEFGGPDFDAANVQATRALFRQFLLDNAPARLRQPDTLDRLVDAQIASTRIPVGHAVAAPVPGGSAQLRLDRDTAAAPYVRDHTLAVDGVVWSYQSCLKRADLWAFRKAPR